MENWKDALKKGIWELIRMVLLAVLPILLVQLQNGQFDWKTVWTAGGIAFLRALDAFVKEWDAVEAKGIVPGLGGK